MKLISQLYLILIFIAIVIILLSGCTSKSDLETIKEFERQESEKDKEKLQMEKVPTQDLQTTINIQEGCQYNNSLCISNEECSINNECVPRPYDYFTLNKGNLNCGDPYNIEFCDWYNSAKKFYGFGMYNLRIGDAIIIEPFIIKWTIRYGWLGTLEVIWIGPDDKPNIVAELEYSLYGVNLSSVQSFEGIYAYTKLSEISLEGETLFTFTNSCQQILNWCESEEILDYGKNLCKLRCYNQQLPNEVKYRTQNIISYSDVEPEDFNAFLAKSFQTCYNEVKNFLQIDRPIDIAYSRFLLVEGGGGGGLCNGGMYITCQQSSDIPYTAAHLEQNLEQIEQGKCVEPVHAHELVHWFVYGTPLGESEAFTLDEGLATYVATKVTARTADFECSANSFTIVPLGTSYGDNEHEPYFNLSVIKAGERGSYKLYYTAACVWDYINTTYGHDKFIEVINSIEGLRYKPGTYDIFADIINPILGEDVLPILGERFGVSEITVEKEL